ncbi:MAG TPA: Hint domain-containing protein, partial [Rhodanobacter sp.]|nr:Hint domain-containing protein [Rhodanobacter sp.]
PRSDLFLSPDHAVYVDGVLIPIKHLINRTTIARMPIDTIVYYHIELPSHDILLAEGMPAESWLDTGDRACFDNFGCIAAPHRAMPGHERVARICEAIGYAPLIVAGPRLHAVRRIVDDRAASIWHGQPAEALA